VPKPYSPCELLAKIRQHLSETADYLLQCMSLLMADFVAEVGCSLFWSVIPSL
jgi:hypothetical protein